MRRSAVAPLLGGFLAVLLSGPPLAAQGWVAQSYLVSAEIETDAETLAHPSARVLRLVLPADLPLAQVCVDSSASSVGRTRVRVFLHRAEGEQDGDGEPIEFEWRRRSGNLTDRCSPVGALAAGDLVEYRFAFFDMPPLRVWRRGQRIERLPSLTVAGWVENMRGPQ